MTGDHALLDTGKMAGQHASAAEGDALQFKGGLSLSNLRILRGIRVLAETLGRSVADPRQAELIGLIDMTVGELINRHDIEFYAGMFARADALVARSLALLGSGGSDLRTARAAAAERFDGAANFDLISADMAAIGGCLYRAVTAIGETGTAEARTLLADIVTWEIDMIAPRHDTPPPPAQSLSGTGKLTPTELQNYLCERFPGRADVTVDSMRIIPGGFSKITTLFETRDAAMGPQALVMRAEQPITQYHMDGSDISNEYPTVRFAFEAGLPVAEPLWYEGDAAKLGARFFVSRKAAGSNVGDILAGRQNLSRETLHELMRILAQIHATPLDPANALLQNCHLGKWMRNRTMTESARASVLYWRDIAIKCGSHTSPAITRGFNWLLDNLPASDLPPVLVHGDYGMHNIMIDDGRVTAVLDWEASHVGDPADEFILLFKAMAAYIPADELYDIYLSYGGRHIDPYRFRFFEVLCCLKAPSFGYGALKVIEEDPGADLKLSYVHYHYNYPIVGNLNAAIAAAEAAR